MSGALYMLAAVLLVAWMAQEPDYRLGMVPGFAVGSLIGAAIVAWATL